MSNLPKVGDTIKTGTLEEIKAIEGVYIEEGGDLHCIRKSGYVSADAIHLLGLESEIRGIGVDHIWFLGDDEVELDYPKWAYEALLSKPTKQPKRSPLEAERDQLEARLAEVKEGVRLESEIKTDATNLKVKRARLAEIKKNGGK